MTKTCYCIKIHLGNLDFVLVATTLMGIDTHRHCGKGASKHDYTSGNYPYGN